MNRLAEGLGWAAVCLLVWLSMASSVTAEELIVAVAASVVSAAAAIAGRSAVRGRWTLRRVWLRRAVRLPVAIAIATVAVLGASLRLRPRRGRMTRLDVTTDEPVEVGASHRALGALALAAAPTSYVVDTDPDSGAVTVHQLGDALPSWAQVGMREE
jgi:multisubunit Na+/H+ antiporter MnhE subunit